jgi:Kef-type K+ transport system membrane component KefB
MSGGGGTKHTFGERAAQIAAMVLVFALMFAASRLVPEIEGAAGIIGAVGFLLLAGMLMSELFEIIGLPHLTGYLFAGALAGPQVLHLIDHHTVERLKPTNTLALALIALQGGAELRVELLKQVFKSLIWATVIQCTLGMVAIAAAFFAATPYLPFTKGMSWTACLGVTMLWSVLAVTRSPSATLGILSQLRPDGPVTRFSLSFVMTSDIVVVTLLTAAIAFARPLVEPGAAFSFRDFYELGFEVLGSIAVGTTLGLVLIAYLWLVGGKLLLVLLAIGFGLTELLGYLHFDSLLVFMVAGFVVANLSQQGHKLLDATNQAGSVVYVVFFATAGAHLDIALLRKFWPIAIYLAGVRMLFSFIAHRVSARFANDEPAVKNWGWACLFSQAGLALGMSAVIEKTFPSFGAGFRSMAVAMVAINETVGPVLFKFALDRAGESGKGTLEKGFHEAEHSAAAPAEAEATG